MRKFRLFHVAVAVAVTAVAAATSGPDKGSSPMLSIQPANQTGEAYCVTCKSGRNPAVVAFLTANDEATQKLLVALADEAKRGRDKHLTVTAIVLGSGSAPQGLVDFAKEQHLDLPVAVLPRDDEGLESWKIDDEVSNTVVFFHHHRVDHSVADLSADKLSRHVDDLLGTHHPPRGGSKHK